MRAIIIRVAICAAVVMILAITAGAIWLERRHLACERRSKAFSQQVEDIRRGAREEIKVGAGKTDVARFFEKRGIRVFVTNSEATGTLITSGCSPFGCGTDEALIGVRVKLSTQGIVTEEPQVVDLYTNCL
jgi:uncharacterized membrane-anchored protein